MSLLPAEWIPVDILHAILLRKDWEVNDAYYGYLKSKVIALCFLAEVLS